MPETVKVSIPAAYPTQLMVRVKPIRPPIDWARCDQGGCNSADAHAFSTMALPTLEQNRTRRLQVYAFASTVDATVRALTPDDTGANLPEAYAPWRQNGWGTAITVESATDPIAVGVRRDGFLLVGGGSRDG